MIFLDIILFWFTPTIVGLYLLAAYLKIENGGIIRIQDIWDFTERNNLEVLFLFGFMPMFNWFILLFLLVIMLIKFGSNIRLL